MGTSFGGISLFAYVYIIISLHVSDLLFLSEASVNSDKAADSAHKRSASLLRSSFAVIEETVKGKPAFVA